MANSVIRGNSLDAVVDSLSSSQAEADTVKLGGHLVTINDVAENQWLHKTNDIHTNRYPPDLKTWRRYWIGLINAQSQRSWLGLNSEKLDYTNWNPGESNE